MIYLDYHAATPLCDAARSALTEALDVHGNPSSLHGIGRNARRHLEAARGHLADAIGAVPGDVIFTSGGTESCNAMVLGARIDGSAPERVVTTQVEHPAMSEAINRLESEGAEVVRLAVPEGKPPAAEALCELLTAKTLVALQWVNSETGTLFPIAEYAKACLRSGALFVVDACQALGRVPINVASLPGLSAMAFASQKIGGPGGAGALWHPRDVSLVPRELGGAQERGRRAGTPAVGAIMGFGAAARVLPERLERMNDVARWRDRLEQALLAHGASINGAEAPRVASVVDASIPGWRGDILVAALDVEGIAASSGPACSSGVTTRRKVLSAMYPEQSWRSRHSLRLSLGPETLCEAKITKAIAILDEVLSRITDA